MPTMTSGQLTKATTIQTNIGSVKAGINTAISSLWDLYDDAMALNTVESITAGNALMGMVGALQEAKGIVTREHSRMSTALVTYDGSTSARAIPTGGGGGRKS